MAKWIYNDDTVQHTYMGQEIASAVYYNIVTIEESRMANCAKLDADVTDGKVIISTTGDSGGHITDTTEALAHLKNLG